MTNPSGLLRAVQRYWLLLFFTLSLLLVALYLSDLMRHFTMPTQIRPRYLALAALFQISVWLDLVVNWKFVVKSSTKSSVGYHAALVQYAMLNFGKYIPGKVWGMVARASQLARQNLDPAEIAGATLYEQVFVFHSALVVSVIFGSMAVNGRLAWLLGVAALASLAAGPVLGSFGIKAIGWALVALGKIEKPSVAIRMTTPTYFRLLCSYALAWILQGFVLVALFYALRPWDAGFEPGIVAVMITANTISMIVGFVAIFAPAGIGVRELTLIPILSTVLPPANALLLSLVLRIWTVACDLVFGGSTILFGRIGALLKRHSRNN